MTASTPRLADPDSVAGLLGLAGAELGADAARAHDRLRWEMFEEAAGFGLPDRYRVLERLGRGGGGVVYAAHDRSLGRAVAIKIEHSAHLRGAEAHARLSREARAAARLNHPNVVRVFDVGVTELGVYIVMERIHGCNLKTWLEQRDRPWREIVAAFKLAGLGLAQAHRVGLLHRDFKPSNVLVGDDGRICVVDFGLARPMHALSSAPGSKGAALAGTEHCTGDEAQPDWSITERGRVAGTPEFMAPEQHRGDALGPESDVYSFCVALYGALYGARPFPGTTPTALLRSKETSTPPIARSRVPAWLGKVLVRGLHPMPSQRWLTMDALLRALTEPRRHRRGVFVGAAVGAIVLAAWPSAPAASQRCEGRSLWSAAQRSGTAAVLAAEEVVGHARLEATLDEYATRWASLWDEACAAPPAVRDAKSSCLAERGRHFEALVELLNTDDSITSRGAASAVESLPSLRACEDPRNAPTQVPVEHKPAVEAIFATIARARALTGAGRSAEAIVLARAAAADAVAVDYLPALVQAEHAHGRAALMLGDYPDAHRAHERMFFSAARAGLSGAQVEAARAIAFVAADREEDLELADTWIRRARSSLRDEEDGGKLASVEEVEGAIAMRRGEPTKALELMGSALQRLEREVGPGASNVAHARVNMANALSVLGRHADALPLYRRAASAWSRAFGPAHPQTALALMNLGNAQAELDDLDAAVESYRGSLEAFTASYGEASLIVAQVRMNLASTLQELGQSADARAEAERALQDQIDGARKESVSLALAYEAVAWLYKEQGDLDDAEQHVAKGLGVYDRLGLSTDPRTGSARLLQGHLQLARGDVPAARESYEHVVALLEGKDIDPSQLASAKFALAKVLDPGQRACELAQLARAGWHSTGAHVDKIADAGAWLGKHCG